MGGVRWRPDFQTTPAHTLLIDPNAKKIFGIKGHGGSSAVVPPKFITPHEGISNYVSGKVDIVENVEEADAVFLVLGLDHGGTMLKTFLFKKEGDSEGMDRTDYALPKEQIDLIKLLEKNKLSH